jgi:hypothetical protein
MNKYIASYKGQKIVIESDTIYHAHLEAIRLFKVTGRRQTEVIVWIIERAGVPVVHSTCEL